MKLKEWNARLHGLVIFRTLLEDPVLAKLLDLTDRMEAGRRAWVRCVTPWPSLKQHCLSAPQIGAST